MFNLKIGIFLDIYCESKRLFFIAFHHPEKILRAGAVLILEGPNGIKKRIKRQDVLEDYQSFINSQYGKVWKKLYPKSSELKKQKTQAIKFRYKPLVSIIMPTYNTDHKYLIQALESVCGQSYENWQLCIADDASNDKQIRNIIEKYAKIDPRIEFVFRETGGHISNASNSALEIAKGEYVGFLDHDDILWPNALFEVVKVLNNNKETAEFIYSDEDKLDEDGKTHIEPFFKPQFSPDYLRSINYIVHFTVIKKSQVEKVGGFRTGVEGAQDWDLFLRVTSQLKKENIFHIPKVLYSWRISSSSSSSAKASQTVKSYAFKRQKVVLEYDLQQRNINGRVLPTQYQGLWRVKYDLSTSPKVSIIIPTKDSQQFIKNCLDSIVNKTTYKNFEVIVIDTGSQDKMVFEIYDIFQKKIKNFYVLKWTEKFNFSKVCNFGVKQAKGQYIIFLNNDTQVISDNWIENMLEYAQQPLTGAVGCKLLFPSGRIQHIGVVLGISGGMIKKGIAGHPFKNFYHQEINNGYSRIVDSVMNYSAVTAACLMVAKNKFMEVGGFDPKLRIAFNDVDFCLKLLQKGYFNVYTPFTTLVHFESVSVGKPGKGKRSAKEFIKEAKLMRQKWGSLLLNDPYYNPNYTLKNEEYTLNI